MLACFLVFSEVERKITHIIFKGTESVLLPGLPHLRGETTLLPSWGAGFSPRRRRDEAYPMGSLCLLFEESSFSQHRVALEAESSQGSALPRFQNYQLAHSWHLPRGVGLAMLLTFCAMEFLSAREGLETAFVLMVKKKGISGHVILFILDCFQVYSSLSLVLIVVIAGWGFSACFFLFFWQQKS